MYVRTCAGSRFQVDRSIAACMQSVASVQTRLILPADTHARMQLQAYSYNHNPHGHGWICTMARAVATYTPEPHGTVLLRRAAGNRERKKNISSSHNKSVVSHRGSPSLPSPTVPAWISTVPITPLSLSLIRR